MAFFPFMMEVQGKDILIVGGGRSAFHKVRSFLNYGATITVIAETISPDIRRLSGEMILLERSFEEDDVKGRAAVVAATEDRGLNRRIACLARQQSILVNAVDDKEYCDFIFPAILRKENYTVAVCTDGKSPLLAGRIRNSIDESLPDEFDEAVSALGEMREEVLAGMDSPHERSRIFRDEAERILSRRVIRIGTRGSALAMAQTERVIRRLQEAGIRSELVVIRTQGDRQTEKPLWAFGGKAVFVSEFEEAILSGKIDLAIHSAKDLPAVLPDGLELLACPEREDPREVLVSLAGRRPEDIRLIGTSSRRRQALILERSDRYQTRPLRGNVPSRLTKLRRGEFDAVILAAAGLKRLELDQEADLRYEYLDPVRYLPAAGQGTIAVEGASHSEISALIRSIDVSEVSAALRAERRFMREIRADCHEAVSAWAEILPNGSICFRAMKQIGEQIVRVEASGADAEEAAVRAAAEILGAERS
ncbi:MAG: hydroxymethylbilane synthase [Mogibacterium sp.]|nr:hydroxymethylbilane synthase [Mogibacterium sp.]